MTWVRVALAGVAVALGAAAWGVAASNGTRPMAPIELGLSALVGWSFALSGLVAWQMRPDNRIGPVMIGTSYLWSLALLYRSQDPVLFTIGHLLQPAYLGGIMYVLLAFPTGRLETPFVRRLFAVIFVLTFLLEPVYVLLGGHAHGTCVTCPPTVWSVANAPDAAWAVMTVMHGSGVLAAVLAFAVLVQRWRTATSALRFAITPVVWSGAALSIVVGLWVLSDVVDEPWMPLMDGALNAMLVALAASFLAGVARSRLARSAVADLMIELSGTLQPGALRAALSRALHDPSLVIAYWLPDQDRFVDAEGGAIAMPSAEQGRSVTLIERDGRRIAAFVHDPAVDDERLMRSASAAAALALENERLQAELRAQLAEMRASRARVVEAAEQERRRIERDLHDGTQQRLVSIAMTLGLAEAKAATDGAGARELIAESRAAMSATLAELRELSQGIHPGILAERGLAHALDELVMRLRMPIELEVTLDVRLPLPVETTAYYVVSEGLTNVAKYADATRARVRVTRENGSALVEIADDGKGGADPTRGSGLRGLRDRVEAVGGRFQLTSAQGRGTTLRAELPCA